MKNALMQSLVGLSLYKILYKPLLDPFSRKGEYRPTGMNVRSVAFAAAGSNENGTLRFRECPEQF